MRLEQVLPATYAGNWQPSPDPIGLSGPHESLLYVVAPGAAFPAGATNSNLPLLQGQTVTLTNWPAGKYFAEWYDPATATRVGSAQGAVTNGTLTLVLPDFAEDLAGIVYPPPRLKPLGTSSGGLFQFEFDSETGGSYQIQKSTDLVLWFDLAPDQYVGDNELDRSRRNHNSASLLSSQTKLILHPRPTYVRREPIYNPAPQGKIRMRW